MPLIQLFGEDSVRKIYSRTWQYREEGLNEIEGMLLNEGVQDEAKGFVNGVAVAKLTIGDKMA